MTPSTLTFSAALLLALTTSACSSGRADSAAQAKAVAVGMAAAEPAPLQLAAGRADLVFRYLDPATGTVATAGKLDDVPAAARRQVVVYDPLAPSPAGWDHVADLSGGFPAVGKPMKDFAFAVAAASAPPRSDEVATSGSHEVVMFTTAGCGYCAKARKYFKSNAIPFTELDIEADPKAPARLGALGQRAGLTQQDLQGVPIIFVDGKPVLGWDAARVAQLLGRQG